MVSLAGFAANASVPVGDLDPTVEFWTDISLEHGGGLSSHGDFVQRSWTSDPSTNLLETRAACESVMALSGPGDHVMLHIVNRIAAAYIGCQGDSRSNVLSQEALLLWEQAVSRDVTFLPPQWIPTGGNTATDFLSRHNVAQWISMLDRRMLKPILDLFSLQPS